MATTELEAPPRRERLVLLILGGAGLVVGGIILLAYLNRPPQMGTSAAKRSGCFKPRLHVP